MSNPLIKIVNSETGEEVERSMTKIEFDQYKAGIAELQAINAELQARDSAKSALLEKLGITAEEAKLILG